MVCATKRYRPVGSTAIVMGALLPGKEVLLNWIKDPSVLTQRRKFRGFPTPKSLDPQPTPTSRKGALAMSPPMRPKRTTLTGDGIQMPIPAVNKDPDTKYGQDWS